MSRPHSPAAERNRKPIADALCAALPARGSMLELGAGTGQHADYLSERLPGWRWLPSEHPEQLEMLRAGLDGVDRPGLRAPIALDVADAWPDERFDAIYSANTAHIMAWSEVEAMFSRESARLAEGGLFLLYGPFQRGGRHHAASNAEFDRMLKQRDPRMGVRDIEALDALAPDCRLHRTAELLLPANNHILIFESMDASK